MKTVCVTGHRPKGFPWTYGGRRLEDRLYAKKLSETVGGFVQRGYFHFMSGGAIGVDMDFADTVLDMRKKQPVTLEIAVPCDNQAVKWNAPDQKRYKQILNKADNVTFVGNAYTPTCMQKRNIYMVDRSDIVLAVWNGAESGGTWNTICYAKRIGKPIEFIYLQDIVEAVHTGR